MTRTDDDRSTPPVTIDLERLNTKDHAEAQRLLQAAQSPGFFYLDFRNHAATNNLAAQTEDIYQLARRYFAQPREMKVKDVRKDQPASCDRGYKFCESDESFEISYDEMKQGTLHLPELLGEEASLLNTFHNECHSAAHTLLSCLADMLTLPLEDYHQDGEPSETGFKLVAEPSLERASEVQENKHTDSGTLTILFYDKWGLQICLPTPENEWVFIPPPQPGCALVHGGNSLQRLSNYQLQSPLHRVTQPQDGAAERYFLSYFLRPAKTVARHGVGDLPD
ncbi:hypothetical protein DTO027B5_5298 [Paecilomyces variotii]|nr:hypothetical protein DTO032I3_709 [Paecilomyces variotii]KAJ9282575.1 hypothetical protein DTO021D3_723 [Paecilomyces variotii]KAJ9308332.1 hypothetical protein DTO217A2_2055 [Paecilomyces variotii]KAJ9320845.1 hypothetical protein DTO027B3_8157 [Paecilomyces variotii]KAJ9332871.1 hypothetical protein DTO027B5_5298 [Paecilomyces variotii]